MYGRIPEQAVADVRERTDIVQVVGQHVALKRSGSNFVGLCPFHDEKTPSFNVNPARQFFHCFGCHESGDVISFLMKIEGRRFVEVVEDLAARAGVQLPREAARPGEAAAAARRRSERQAGIDLNALAAAHYEERLASPEGAEARRYLHARGVSAETAARFRLGWAPRGGDSLLRRLRREGADLDLAVRFGLIAQRRGGGYRDRFWNRVIFPVIGAGGEVIAFGGRLIGEADGPKYINSPETPLYRKGRALYGLHAARRGMRAGGAIVVEGNFDVIVLHQAGFAGAVAPMGTALTDDHLRVIRRFTDRVVALFDGDAAGRKAARRTVAPLLRGEVDGKIATLPQGEDPDSLVRSGGAEALDAVLRAAKPALDFAIDAVVGEMEDTIPGRARALDRIAPLLRLVADPVARDLYAGRVAAALRVDPAHVWRALRGGGAPPGARVGSAPPAAAEPAASGPPPHPVELALIGLLVEHPHLFPRAGENGVESLLTNPLVRATYLSSAEMQRENGRVDTARLLRAADPRIRGPLAEVLLSGRYAGEVDATRALDDCIAALRVRHLERERNEIRDEIARARAQGDADAERTLAVRFIEVGREIQRQASLRRGATSVG